MNGHFNRQANSHPPRRASRAFAFAPPFLRKGEEFHPLRSEGRRGTPRAQRGRAAAGGCHSGGFTLVELMVAMLLGLIVIAGVTSVFLAGQKSYRTNNALGEVEDGSRIAFELMSRDIREAGLTNCDTASGRIANVLNDQGTYWWANFGNALHGYGGAQTDPAVGTGTGVGERVANTDSLQIIGAESPYVTVSNDSEPTGNITLNDASTLQNGNIVVVCSPDHAAIVQLATYDGGTKTAVHNTANTLVPGNCSLGLGYPTVCTTSGNIYSFPTNSVVAALGASDWYIGNNAERGTSLYRVSLTDSGTAVGTQAEEMVRNVTGMQIAYLQGGTTFVTAPLVTDWGAVTAVRVTLTLRSTFQRASVTGNSAISRSYSATTTVRNRVN